MAVLNTNLQKKDWHSIKYYELAIFTINRYYDEIDKKELKKVFKKKTLL